MLTQPLLLSKGNEEENVLLNESQPPPLVMLTASLPFPPQKKATSREFMDWKQCPKYPQDLAADLLTDSGLTDSWMREAGD